jgi:hypothetical protein
MPDQHHLEVVADQLEDKDVIDMQASLHNKFPPPSHEEQPATEPLHLYAKHRELTSPDWRTPVIRLKRIYNF